jgi:hypothetical protein
MGERMKEEDDTDRGENERWGSSSVAMADEDAVVAGGAGLLVVVVGWSYHSPRHAHLGSHSSHHHSSWRKKTQTLQIKKGKRNSRFCLRSASLNEKKHHLKCIQQHQRKKERKQASKQLVREKLNRP